MIHKLAIIPFRLRCKYVRLKLRRWAKKRKNRRIPMGRYDEVYYRGMEELEKSDRES